MEKQKIEDTIKKYLKRINVKELKNIPNLLTLFRILSIPFIASFLVMGAIPAAVGLFGFSAFTDFLDGYIARKKNLVTETGKILDTIADKLFLFSLTPLLFVHPNPLATLLLQITALNEVAISGVNVYGCLKDCKVASNQIGRIKTWTLFGSGGAFMLSLLIPELLIPASVLSLVNMNLEFKTFEQYLHSYKKDIEENKKINLTQPEEKNNEKELELEFESNTLEQRLENHPLKNIPNYEENKIYQLKKTDYE